MGTGTAPVGFGTLRVPVPVEVVGMTLNNHVGRGDDMNMTKRDIADIALVWVALSFFLTLLASLVQLGGHIYIGMTDDANKYTDKASFAVFQTLHTLALLLLNYVFLFKRSLILSLVFPDGREKEVAIPSGLTVLTTYAFWIRLLGIFTFLSSGILVVARLTTDVALIRTDVAIKNEFVEKSWMYWMYNGGTELVSTVLAAIVIWKADWLAKIIGKIPSSTLASRATSESAPSADSSGREG
jgi:hypothetical protein